MEEPGDMKNITDMELVVVHFKIPLLFCKLYK